MAEAVFGTGVVVEILVDPDWYEVLCATDCVFTRTPEFIEKTSPVSGRTRAFAVRREEWDLTVSGLTKIANSASLTFFYMLQTAQRWAEQDIKITFTDADGANVVITGTALIGAESISGPATDFAQCSIDFKGTGPFTISGVQPPAEVEYILYSDWWTPVNGDNFISGSSSGLSPSAVAFGSSFNLGAGDILLDVAVEGDHFNLINTGTPGNMQCKPVLGLGQVTFATDMIFTGAEKVYVEFKRPV